MGISSEGFGIKRSDILTPMNHGIPDYYAVRVDVHIYIYSLSLSKLLGKRADKLCVYTHV